MIDFSKFFIIAFASKEISDIELKNYTNVHLVRMVANNPGMVFTPRIVPTQTALQAFTLATSTDQTKLGVQKAQTSVKETFKANLPDHIAKIYGTVMGAFGAKAPELLEIFPQGRTGFRKCIDNELKPNLQQLVTALTAKTPPLAQTVLDSATALLTTWTGIYGTQSAAKGTKKSAAETCADLRAALEQELQRNLLTIAMECMGDPFKAALYCPQEYLRNRAGAVTPGPTTLTLAGQDAQPRTARFTMTATDAESFRLLRCMAGEADLSVVAEDIEPVDGVGSYAIYLEGTATYEFAAEAVRGTRTGERSGIVSVGPG